MEPLAKNPILPHINQASSDSDPLPSEDEDDNSPRKQIAIKNFISGTTTLHHTIVNNEEKKEKKVITNNNNVGVPGTTIPVIKLQSSSKNKVNGMNAARKFGS